MGACNFSVTLRVLLCLGIPFVHRDTSNTAQFLGILVVDACCAVPRDLLYCLRDSEVDWPAWEHVPRGSTVACSDRCAMRDFVPSLWTLGILWSGTPL